jgi:hypothetical protein
MSQFILDSPAGSVRCQVALLLEATAARAFARTTKNMTCRKPVVSTMNRGFAAGLPEKLN